MSGSTWKLRRGEIMRRIELGDGEGALASFDRLLDQEQSPRVFALGAQVADRLAGSDDLIPVRLEVLRSFTVEPAVASLRAYCLRHRLALSAEVAGFDQFEQVIFGTHPEGDGPDAVLIASRLEELVPGLARTFAARSSADVAQLSDHVIDRVAGWLAGLRERSARAALFLVGFALPEFPSYGIADSMVELGHRRAVAALNGRLADLCRASTGAYFVDIDHVISRLGYRHAYDRRMEAHARLPLSADGIAAVGRHLGRVLAAAFTPRRKCIVLDCDNTLWGGVLGEDGPDGIELGADYPGIAYRQFQQALLNLHERGVILAVASKNNEADVLEVVDGHPHQVLRREHFAALRINWNDKVTSIRELAAEIKIGTDSMVFIDDSAFECAMVRERLPEVETVQVPDNPLDLSALAYGLDSLDVLRVSAEDRARGDMYRAQAERTRAEVGSGSLDSFLESLDLALTIEYVSGSAVDRAAQLTGRTNQFNLTTRRHTAADIEGFVDSQAHAVFQVRLRDRFGDYGVCGLVIGSREGDAFDIDTMLLSCRVIGRGVEDALVTFVEHRAADDGASELLAHYLPTRKNALVSGFFDRLDYERADRDGGAVDYRRALGGDRREYPSWFTIVLPGTD